MKRMMALLLALVLWLPVGAGAASLDELAGLMQGQTENNDPVLTSPAFLLGGEGALLLEDVAMGDQLYDAYGYPLCQDADAFAATYEKWMTLAGYEMTAVTINDYSAYQLTAPSGLCAYLIPRFSKAAVLFIPEGITVGPLVLPDPADYCSAAMAPTHDQADSGFTWYFYRTEDADVFDYKRYFQALESQYGFKRLLDEENAIETIWSAEDYTSYTPFSVPGYQGKQLTARGSTCDFMVYVNSKVISSVRWTTMGPALANGAVGIVASGYEDNGVYFAKSGAGGERTQSGEPAKQSASPTVKPTAKPTEAPKACNYCGGSGWQQHSFCRGSGKNYMAGSGYRSCPSCGGTGRVRCNYCGGTGKR